MENEWIEWAGGKCPFEWRRRVEVRLRDGDIYEMDAMDFDWHFSALFTESGIVAYRVLA